MKIVYSHQIFTRQVYGGVSRYFHEISSRIPGLEGDTTEIYSPLHVNAYLSGNMHLGKNSIKVSKFPGGAAILGSINLALGSLSIRHKPDIDLYHETYYSSFSYSPKRSRRVVTVYDMIHEKYPDSFSRFDPTPALKTRAIHAADHVICISESTRRDLIDLCGISSDKTSVIHLGHSLTATKTIESSVTRDTRRPFLLYVGHRHGYKNFAALLIAFSRSRSLRADHTLVCFGGGKFTPTELSIMQSLGLCADVVRHTEGDDKILSGLYAGASAFIYPSLYEGFGIPPLEAMAHGCPVVCADTSSLPEVVGDAAELFLPTDVEALEQAIENVTYSESRRAALIELGYERIKHFSWDKCAGETLAVYKRILGESRS